MALFSWVPILSGLNENDTFLGFKIRGHCIFLHYLYRKSLIRGYWNSWIGSSTKTTKIGSPQKLSHPQLIITIKCDTMSNQLYKYTVVYEVTCDLLCPPWKKEGHIALYMSVSMSVCWSVSMLVSLNLVQLIAEQRFAPEASNLAGR